MSTSSGLEIIERAAVSGGRLLRAEANRLGSTSAVLVLTFDVGRIVVRPGKDGLVLVQAENRDQLPEDLVVLDADEPWWRLLGQPITAAWPGGAEEGVGAGSLDSLMVLKLRFRAESDHPRIVLVESAGEVIRVTLEAA